MIAALVSIALVSAEAPDSRPAPKRPGLTWAAADSLMHKLDQVEAALAKPKDGKVGLPRSLEVSERELNSYLNLTLGPKVPPELSDVAFQIGSGRLLGTGSLDLDRVKAKLPPQGSFSPLNFLSGLVAVELDTQLSSKDGVGSFVVDEVRLGGVSIPVSFLQQIVLTATRTRENPAGFDVKAPFRLPYAIRQVRLEPGKAVLDF